MWGLRPFPVLWVHALRKLWLRLLTSHNGPGPVDTVDGVDKVDE